MLRFGPGIIISIQHTVDSVFHEHAALFCRECRKYATAFRTEGLDSIASMPRGPMVIGLIKRRIDSKNTLITPTYKDAFECVVDGADYVAMECSQRVKPIYLKLAVKHKIDVIADVADLRHAKMAEQCGAKAVTTALSGYINAKPATFAEPDICLVEDCVKEIKIPVIAEGRYWTRDHVRLARQAGAYAVCIGTAITDPKRIAKRFYEAWKS